MRRIPKHPKGRPGNEQPHRRLTTRLVVYTDPELMEKVTRIAKAQRISCSDVIRYAVGEIDESAFTDGVRPTPIRARPQKSAAQEISPAEVAQP